MRGRPTSRAPPTRGPSKSPIRNNSLFLRLHVGTIHESNTSHTWMIHNSNPEQLLVFKTPHWDNPWVKHLPHMGDPQVQFGTTPQGLETDQVITLPTLCHQCPATGAADQLSQLSGPGLVVMCRLRPGWDQSTVGGWAGKKAVGDVQLQWSEVKWSEVKWSEVKWSEVKWSEVKWLCAEKRF